MNDDGHGDIIVSQTAARPYFSAFNGSDNTLLTRFRTPSSNGATIASHDMNGDGHADLLAVVMTGGRTSVKTFSGMDNALLESMDTDIKGRFFVA